MTEAVAFTHNLQADPVTASNYLTILAQPFGSRAALTAAEYPVAAYPSPFQALSAVLTDYGRLPIGACSMLPLDDIRAERRPSDRRPPPWAPRTAANSCTCSTKL
jgi:hypothetical protein